MKLNIDIVVEYCASPFSNRSGIKYYKQCRLPYAMHSVCCMRIEDSNVETWASQEEERKYHIIKQTVCHHVSTHMCICEWSRSCCQMEKQMEKKELWMLKHLNKYKTYVHKLNLPTFIRIVGFLFSYLCVCVRVVVLLPQLPCV